ncbi:VOC family protein [Seonamhaeicola aphaedonensis]|uniref:Glyoxalase-like protein n=1 Tax=Seonamhaeicola aphaedonensis TaxID=1461338 RepID=A0A3D9H666_9FLAO|nr:VOC family protein [Seonamhaeicola aphaedonensis]RED44998.1 glyoxalase-like protein [Seonamhaeicola aphaedonensis]
MDLNQITIPSLNVARAMEFYKILGLQLIVDALPRYVRFECPDGNSTLSIHHVDEISKDNGITIYFEDDYLDTLVENLQQKGIEFSQLPKDKNWLWREAHLNDFDGNKIILYHAGKNRKNPPWRIS